MPPLQPLVLLLIACSSAAFEVGGDDACRCIDPSQYYDGLACTNETLEVLNPDVANLTCTHFSVTLYGSQGCGMYDQHNAGCLRNDPMGWCSDRWCFVLPSTCARPRAPSAAFPNARLRPQFLPTHCGTDPHVYDSACDERLTYSYATCGNIDTFSSEHENRDLLQDIANRAPLRIGIPGDEDFHLVTVRDDQEGVGGTRRDGSTVAFADSVLARYNIRWTEVPISQDSRDFSPMSSYTACVHDIALNRTDMCFGPFWTTEYRRRMAAFTGSLFSSRMHLVVPTSIEGPDAAAWQLVAAVFKPFSNEVWGWLFVTMMFVGFIRWVIEPAGESSVVSQPADEDEDEDYIDSRASSPTPGLTSIKNTEQIASISKKLKHRSQDELAGAFGESQVNNGEAVVMAIRDAFEGKKERPEDEEGPRRPHPLRRVLAAFQSLAYHEALVLQGCVGDWRGDDPRNLSQWILLIGASFSMLVITTFYTAQVTQNLIFANKQVITAASMAEVIDHRLTICSLEAIRPAFESYHPEVGTLGLYRPVPDMPAVLAGMDDGTCQVGVVPMDSWDYLTASDPTICQTKTVLDATVYDTAVAMPVRGELAAPITWAIDRGVETGRWAMAVEAAKSRFLPPVSCELAQSDSRRRKLRGTSGSVSGSDAAVAARPAAAAGAALVGRLQTPPSHRGGARRELRAQNSGAAASATVSSTTDEESVSGQLDLTGAAGPFIIAFLTALAALTVNIVERCLYVATKQAKHRRAQRYRDQIAKRSAEEQLSEMAAEATARFGEIAKKGEETLDEVSHGALSKLSALNERLSPTLVALMEQPAASSTPRDANTSSPLPMASAGIVAKQGVIFPSARYGSGACAPSCAGSQPEQRAVSAAADKVSILHSPPGGVADAHTSHTKLTAAAATVSETDRSFNL